MAKRIFKPHTKKAPKVANLRAGKKPDMKLGIAQTQQAAVSITRLPWQVVQAVKAAGSKAFKANGRIDCDLLMDDAAMLPPVEGAAVDFHTEKALDMRANRLLKTQKWEERAKLLRPIEEFKRAVFKNVIACKSKLYQAENTVAVEAGMRLNLTADQVAAIREIVTKHQRLAIKELHAGEFGRVECPECKKEIKS